LNFYNVNWKEQFEQAVNRQLWSSAEAVLRSFFRTEVANKPERLKDLFAMRAQIKAKKHRFLVSELFADDEKTALKAFSKLGGDLLELLPDSNTRNPTQLKDLDWQPNNPSLTKLMSPFVGTDQLRLRTLGATYADDYIAATDAFTLLYYPQNPTKNRGIYCLTKKCFEMATGDKVIITPHDIKQIIPMLADGQQGYTLPTSQWYQLISLLEDNGFDSYSGNYPVGKFTHEGEDVSINLSLLKKSIKAFLQLGHEEVLIFFFGAEKAVVMLPKKGFDQAAYNQYQQLFTLTMPVFSEKGDKAPYLLKFDLNKGTFGMEASKAHAKIPGIATAKSNPLKAAIEALETATEFAEASAKKELSSAIEALQVALEFA
jgi:hypothetical protein